MNSLCRRIAAIAALAVAAAVLPGDVATAQTALSWTGTSFDANWANSLNWSPTTAPNTTGTFSLTFGGTSRPFTTNDVGTVNIQALNFTNNGSAGNNVWFQISGGTLNFANGSTITMTPSTSLLVTNGIAGDIINSAINLSGTTTITTGTFHSLSLLGPISGSGGLVINASSIATGNAAPFVYMSGSNNYSGDTEIRGGFLQSSSRGGTPANSLSGTSPFGTGRVIISGSGTLLVRNDTVISNAISMSGTGANGNNLTGSFGVAGSTAQILGPVTLDGNAQITTASNATDDSTSRLVIGGTGGTPSTVNLGSNTLTLRSNLTGAGTGTAGLLIDVTSTINGAGNVVITGTTDLARVQLSAANTYSGTTTISRGTLIVNNSSALSTAALVVNTNGLDLNGFSASAGALSGSSSGIIESRVAGAARLTTNSTTSGTYAGVIRNGSGTVGYTKTGSGSQFLTGTSTYTGTTLVNGGRLFVNGSLGATDTTVQTAGTLSGTGSIGGSVTVLSGGTLSPGATTNPSYGTLSIGGNLNLLTGAVSTMEISGTAAGLFDQVVISGTTNFGGTLNISMDYNGVVFGTTADPYGADQWKLFSLTPALTAGDFLSITLSGSYGNVSFFKYGGTDGEWHASTPTGEFAFFTSGARAGILFAVPEPSTLALAAAGGVCLVGVSRLRRRRAADDD